MIDFINLCYSSAISWYRRHTVAFCVLRISKQSDAQKLPFLIFSLLGETCPAVFFSSM